MAEVRPVVMLLMGSVMKIPFSYTVYRNYCTKVQTNIKEEFDDNANLYAVMLRTVWQNNIRNDHRTLQSGSTNMFLVSLLNTKCKCRPDSERP